jgi:hypothetical protein
MTLGLGNAETVLGEYALRRLAFFHHADGQPKDVCIS